MPKQAFYFLMILFFSMTSGYAITNPTLDKKLQTLLDDFRMHSQVPAAVLCVNFPDKNIIHFVSGTLQKRTSIDPHPPLVTINNLFQIGSITKSFTAAIILQLEAEGKLSIEDTLADITQRYGPWLPKNEYSVWKNISIKQLLNMTSGIFSVTEDADFLNVIGQHPEKSWTAQEIIHYAYKNKPYFSPGTGWHYSDTDYYILEILIEAVSKHSFTDEINNRILKKYSLNNTYYLPHAYSENIMQKMAHGYAYAQGGFSPPMTSGSDTTSANMSAASAAGALVSTSVDVTQWVRLLFTPGEVLAPAQLNEMLSAVCTGNEGPCTAGAPLSANSHSQGFSLGLARMYDPELGLMWFYIGGTYGYYSAFIWLPEQKISLALTVNATTKTSKKLLKTLAEMAKLVKVNY